MTRSTTTQYGFRWGPFVVERLAHVDGRGYALEIRTDSGKRLQVYVSEKGRVIKSYPQADYKFDMTQETGDHG